MIKTSKITFTNFNDKSSNTLSNSKKFAYTLKPSRSSLTASKKSSIVTADTGSSIACVSLNTNPEKFIPPTLKKLKLRDSWSSFREFANDNDILRRRKTPFPSLRWAEKQEMWDLMCKKENGIYKRPTGDQLLLRHSAIQPKMRAILLDWLTEVCQEYLLHRETYYLAVDFLDRYLGSINDVPKTSLQSVGVTCLFIASKLEEIYPPKLNGFAFYTDGACSEDDILDMELIILKKLNWGLTPITPNRWIKTYMQLNNIEGQIKPKYTRGNSPDSGIELKEDIMFPQYTEKEYIQAMQLLDLVILDLGSLSFSHSVLAASVLYYIQGQQAALSVSGYTWKELSTCVEWLGPFALALRDSNDTFQPPSFAGVAREDQHNIQTHSVDLSLLEQAQAYQQQDLCEDDQDEDETFIVANESIKAVPSNIEPKFREYGIKDDMENKVEMQSKKYDVEKKSRPAHQFYGLKNDRTWSDHRLESHNGIPVISQYYKQRK